MNKAAIAGIIILFILMNQKPKKKPIVFDFRVLEGEEIEPGLDELTIEDGSGGGSL